MKRYKLIRRYPGSRELGTMVEQVNSSSGLNTRYTDKIGREYGWREIEDYPEYWEEIKESTFKVGDWVVDSRDNGIFRITKIDPIDNRRLFGSSEYEWLHSSYFRLATTQEIETHLIAEAKKRGFAKGVYHRWYEPAISTEVRLVESNDWRYNLEFDCLTIMGKYAYVIYSKGQWAEIVKEEPIIIEGYKGNFNSKGVAFGCKSYSLEQVNQLVNVIDIFEITSFNTRNVLHIDKDLVRKIRDRIK